MGTKVFIPQVTERFDPLAERMVPAFDFSPAARHGELITVLETSDNPLFVARLTPKIRKGLEAFTPDDFLVAVGDPSIIAICAGIILRRQKSMKMLKWDRRGKSYISLDIAP